MIVFGAKRYCAWAGHLIRGDRKHADRERARHVVLGHVGCLHWAYYSIMLLFGKGDVVPLSSFLFAPLRPQKEPYYVLEGVFCLIASIYAAISVLAGIFAIKAKTGYFVTDSTIGLFIMRLMIVCLFLITVISVFVGNRFAAYLVNTVILYFFGTKLMPFLVAHSFLRVVILVVTGFVVLAVEVSANYGVFKTSPKSGGSSAKRFSAPSYSRPSDTASRRNDQEQYRKEYEEDAERREAERKEGKKYQLERELKKLNDELLGQQNRLKDLDKGYEAYLKDKFGYNVDPKVNRREYEKTQKEVSRLKEQIKAKEDEISRL